MKDRLKKLCRENKQEMTKFAYYMAGGLAVLVTVSFVDAKYAKTIHSETIPIDVDGKRYDLLLELRRDGLIKPTKIPIEA